MPVEVFGYAQFVAVFTPLTVGASIAVTLTLEGELFTLIMSFVKMENGDASELWFAIMYNGQAKGGVASETGIESDVDVKYH